MVEVNKKFKENSLNLIRRFSTRVRKSGILIEMKKRQFFQPSISKKDKKEKVLRRLKKIAENK